ncbi:MAG: hypothetical protein ACT4OX_06545 [Actinomycetota bacterium]
MIRDRPRALWLGVYGIAALFAAGASLEAGNSRQAGATLAALLVAIGVWFLLMARRGVRVDAEGIVIVSLLRARRVEWRDISRFDRAEVRNIVGERLTKPVVFRRDGSTEVLPGIEVHGGVLIPRGPKTRFPALDELQRLHARYREGGSGFD